MSARIPTHNRPANARSSGFTLIELAIVLFILTLLLGGVLTPLAEQIAERQNGETRRTLETARIALVGYALRQAHRIGPLPCPDMQASTRAIPNDNRAEDGLEDRLSNGACATLTGNLPWNTLGLSDSDAWGNHLSYAVAAVWSAAGSQDATFSNPTDDELLQVCTDRACIHARPAAAVLISHGRNGFGAHHDNGKQNLMPSSADEIENINADNRFVMRPPRAADRPGGEFDDLLLPISADWLRGRLCDPASSCRTD